MEPCGFIGDGYTEKLYLQAKPGFYPAMRGEWRPPLGEELDRYNHDADKLKGIELRRHAARYMLARLASWDLKDSKGDAVPLTVPNLMRCKDALFMDLMGVLLGARASDLDPRWSDAERLLDQEDEEAAAAAGKSLSEYRQERDRKN